MKSLHQLREEITRLTQERETNASLRLLGRVFLKLGFTGFGGSIDGIAALAFLLLLCVRIKPALIILGCGVLQLIVTHLLSA